MIVKNAANFPIHLKDHMSNWCAVLCIFLFSSSNENRTNSDWLCLWLRIKWQIDRSFRECSWNGRARAYAYKRAHMLLILYECGNKVRAAANAQTICVTFKCADNGKECKQFCCCCCFSLSFLWCVWIVIIEICVCMFGYHLSMYLSLSVLLSCVYLLLFFFSRCFFFAGVFGDSFWSVEVWWLAQKNSNSFALLLLLVWVNRIQTTHTHTYIYYTQWHQFWLLNKFWTKWFLVKVKPKKCHVFFFQCVMFCVIYVLLLFSILLLPSFVRFFLIFVVDRQQSSIIHLTKHACYYRTFFSFVSDFFFLEKCAAYRTLTTI